jgi:hypothetical protein
MKTIKISEATGPVLDWLVAKCEGLLEPMFDEKEPRVVLQVDPYNVLPVWNPSPQVYYQWKYLPSTSWEVGGPIIEREKIDTLADPNGKDVWMGRLYKNFAEFRQFGPTPLISAMRCFCISKLGDTAEIPEEL